MLPPGDLGSCWTVEQMRMLSSFMPNSHPCREVLVYPPSRRRKWQPTPVLLPGKSHARRSLVGCSPWGLEESDTTERLHFPFSLSCIGEGNGNQLQWSCLENPRDGGAWWAAVYGVAQSRTRLKRLSSSSSSVSPPHWPEPKPAAWGPSVPATPPPPPSQA